ncbi:hypothetical protein TRV_04105 [Trichophyton verrucosum HKI 0517]|uniref:Uncharacterized protein n=1 Tax=Trichophyton verrucosum (strain HKI 0517) TaxID=663202 RepID=D4DAF8_TRIVH|nr:uncharacterized protein TRV_04105 [Trichophyton verrucosum HKI 0517]EFE41156.1 hypothetical protein TRV_04105 [Trichophyton verrucosum HKI 0517]
MRKGGRERGEQTREKTRRFKDCERDEEYARAKTERYEQSAKKKAAPCKDFEGKKKTRKDRKKTRKRQEEEKKKKRRRRRRRSKDMKEQEEGEDELDIRRKTHEKRRDPLQRARGSCSSGWANHSLSCFCRNQPGGGLLCSALLCSALLTSTSPLSTTDEVLHLLLASTSLLLLLLFCCPSYYTQHAPKDRTTNITKERQATPWSTARPRDEPPQHGVEVGLFLCADAVAAHLALRDALQLHRVDQLVDAQHVRQVGLVAQHQQRDALQRRLADQVVQLVRRRRQAGPVCGIHDVSTAELAASSSSSSSSFGLRMTYTMALTPRQYRSHIGRKRGWPPRSQLL